MSNNFLLAISIKSFDVGRYAAVNVWGIWNWMYISDIMVLNSAALSLMMTRGVGKEQIKCVTRACAILLADLSLRGAKTPASISTRIAFEEASKDQLILDPKCRQVKDIATLGPALLPYP